MMGDEDDRSPEVAQPAHRPEDALRLGLAEGTGRLVQHDDAGLTEKGPGDLDQLSFAGTEVADDRVGTDGES